MIPIYFFSFFSAATTQGRSVQTNALLSPHEDFELLTIFLRQFARIVTTPNILTEVSNLSNALPEAKKAEYFTWFANRLTLLKEEYVRSEVAFGSRWAKFGLTDAAIAEIARNRYLVLTDDFRLSQALQDEGIDTLNFNHIRELNWQRS